MKQPEARVKVSAIYRIAKLKKEVAHVDLGNQIWAFYMAAKTNDPENVVLYYTDENGENVSMTLKEAGENERCRTVRAVAAVGACIYLRKNDVDAEAIRDIFCLGHYAPSAVLSARGNIFSNNSATKINCRRICDLTRELLK
mgnify:CR=1 FL=1